MLQVQGVFKSYATPQGPLPVLAGVDLHLSERSSLASVSYTHLTLPTKRIV